MTISTDDLVSHVPYLRRYARALTGSQTRGDQYVRICLETLLAEPSRIDNNGDMRVQLFKTFHAVWNVMNIVTKDDEDTNGRGSEALRKSVTRLPSRSRQAILLVALERFSMVQAGEILSVSPEEVRVLVDQARSEIRRQTVADVMIIEDDAIIAMNIADIVTEMGHRVVGTASRHAEALALALGTKPDLVLADIQLEDGDDGVGTVQDILKSIEVPVIFVTGYPQRLLTGEGLEPTYVVTKPFEPETLKTAIGQALSIETMPETVV